MVPACSQAMPPPEEHEVAPKGGYDLVPGNSYSPAPDLSLLPDDIWDRRSDLSGIDLRTDEAMAWIEGELAPFLALNDSFEATLPAKAVAWTYPERIGALIGSFSPGVRPRAFWLTRRDGSGS